MGKKKVLHLINGLEVGGTETQLLRILPELQKFHDNRVCCLAGRGPMGKALEECEIPVYYLDLKKIYDFGAAERFYKIIKDFSPDIIVTYLIHSDLYGRIFGKLFGVQKIISSKRGALLQWEWLIIFDRLTKRLVTHYLVQTETAKKEWVEKLRLPLENFTVIPNGIDIKTTRVCINKEEKKRQLKISEDMQVITCVSRLRRGKGHDVLLAAFERLYSKNKKIVLLIVGDGEREAELKKYVDSFESRKNIYFLGNRNDIVEILAISDLFVLATQKEGMSNAIIEAMTSGVPVVTTDIPENRDLLENGANGILIPEKNATYLEESIKSLLADSELRKKIAQNALKTIENKYDIQIISEKLAAFLERI